MITDTWNGCYPSNWKGEVTEEAFKHPAKFSRKLIARIYTHAFEEGWLKPGDRVLDCFGGVALGALDAMRYGLDWTGIELEPHFSVIGQANIDLWNARYAGRLPHWGAARLIQGDSRQLVQVIQEANGLISSPPYSNRVVHGQHGLHLDQFSDPSRVGKNSQSLNMERYGHTNGQLTDLPDKDFQSVISSPPYSDRSIAPTNIQGREAGNLRMNEGQTYNGVVASPPYSDSINQGRGPNDTERRWERMAEAGVDLEQSIKRGGPNSVYNQPQVYGVTPGQLGAMTGKDYEAVISSPPFENTLSRDVVDAAVHRQWAREHGISNAEFVSPVDMERIGCRDQSYGNTEGNIGNSQGETFWSAARLIVEQAYQVLQPGAHAIWVVKAYVKDRRYVDFPGQWQALCEACGFTTLHEHHAMLVTYRGTSFTIEGDEVHHMVESKSFFRRLAERKGSPRVDYEVVLCMERGD